MSHRTPYWIYVGCVCALTLMWAGCLSPGTPGNDNTINVNDDDGGETEFTKANPGCLSCHAEVEDIHASVDEHIDCTDCHGGDFSTADKETAHVQPTLPVIMDKTVAPLDYDLDYQRFVNPSNLRIVQQTCGQCHEQFVQDVLKGMMATAAGHYAGGLYLNDVVDSKTPTYGTFAISDDDGTVPFEDGAVSSLEDLIVYDPSGDPQDIATHFAAVPGQVCARCHLWSRGKGYRGAEGADGTYRADGCAACHMIYANDGRSLSADKSIDHEQQGHPKVHTITKAIPTEQCVHCHHRGARIGLSFTGRAQMPPRLPSGEGVPGTTDIRFNGNFHYTDSDTNPIDVHGERGMHCIDCHKRTDVMGDGNIYGHMDQATKVRCQTCHGTPTATATLLDTDGEHLTNVARRDGTVVLTSKVDGAEHFPPQAADLVNPDSPNYNPRAACAMNDNHLKESGGLECYACHSSWTPNCFGCHFQRDEREMGLNLVTREEEIGKASTNNKIFEVYRPFFMGPNANGRISPYIVGCQVIADVTAPDGSKILDFVMAETNNGKSGLGINPVQPHTIRGAGNVRTCAECHRSPASLGLGSGNYAVTRNNVYVTAGDGVNVLDFKTDPAHPAPEGTMDTAGALAFAALPNIVEGTADYLYVARGDQGLAIYDMRSGLPANPIHVIDDITAIDVSRAARYLYVVVEGQGVYIYDNEDPASTGLISKVAIPTAVRAVPWGIHLLVPAGDAGLKIVDISDHTNPEIVATVGGMNAVDVAPYVHYQMGSSFAVRAYVADPDFGVRVVDLLPDMASATVTAGLELPGAKALDTYERYLPADDTTPSREHDYLYVAAGENGLRVYDITSPDAIVAVSSLADLGGSADDVDVASYMTPPGVDDYALIANGQLGLQVVDVSDPLNPQLAGTVTIAGASRVYVEVQQLDRFLDEQGNQLKENSHPGAGVLSREDIVRILGADIGDCP